MVSACTTALFATHQPLPRIRFIALAFAWQLGRHLAQADYVPAQALVEVSGAYSAQAGNPGGVRDCQIQGK
ncbi:hypothetical protein [uncultured Hymenobacter sp.]|uniref:hypothetical protein n=1 Tax=uncultured Hymenobacter sp. TaxID=170016 RepID=UPI0035CABC68